MRRTADLQKPAMVLIKALPVRSPMARRKNSTVRVRNTAWRAWLSLSVAINNTPVKMPQAAK